MSSVACRFLRLAALSFCAEKIRDGSCGAISRDRQTERDGFTAGKVLQIRENAKKIKKKSLL